MGLFNWNKKNDSSVVWRNSQGIIACPGDSCRKECDNSCPIYLNTQAITLMQMGEGSKAIPIYEEALKIAPDFYDAYNNLGGIYGQMGNYQKAYDCYKKARELNQKKPNPVFGLMLTSRDLGKYDECLEWCDIYKTLARDGRDVPIRNAVNQKLGKSSSTKTNRF